MGRRSFYRELLLVLGMAFTGCQERAAQPPQAVAPPPPASVPAIQVTLFAAASTTEAVEELVAAYEREHNCKVQLNIGSSAALARQIAQGAQADLFLSASEEWAADLRKKGLVEREVALLGNALVIVVPADSSLKVASLEDLLSDKVRRVALADPESVPAGKYAKAALVKLGLWEKVKPKIVAGDDVRHALIYVERGEAEAGVVYATDAAITKKVRVAATIDAELSGPIRYPLLLLKQARQQQAQSLFDFCSSPSAAEIFRKRGFTILTQK